MSKYVFTTIRDRFCLILKQNKMGSRSTINTAAADLGLADCLKSIDSF